MATERVAGNLVVSVGAAQLRHAPIGALSQLAAGSLGGAARGSDEVRLGVRVGIAGRPCRAEGTAERGLRGRDALGGRITVVGLDRIIRRQIGLERSPVGRLRLVGVGRAGVGRVGMGRARTDRARTGGRGGRCGPGALGAGARFCTAGASGSGAEWNSPGGCCAGAPRRPVSITLSRSTTCPSVPCTASIES